MVDAEPAWRARLRLARRLAESAPLTLGLWACMDAETALAGGKDPDRRIQHKWVGRWASRVLELLDLDLAVDGRPYQLSERLPDRDADGHGRLFVMNHRSAIDIMVTFAVTEGSLVSRHDLAGWPVVGKGAQRLGTLFVDRSSMRSGAAVLKVMTRALEQGQGIAIYPEGTAFAGDEVRPFRPGAFRAAQRTGAPLVPMGIAYADESAYYGDESFAAHVERVMSKPGLRAAVEIGEPIHAREGETLVSLRDRVHEAVQALVHRARARLS
ncbi:MAG: lysophospholipid acyltransferase family protein [Polyangiaceae bacterium]